MGAVHGWYLGCQDQRITVRHPMGFGSESLDSKMLRNESPGAGVMLVASQRSGVSTPGRPGQHHARAPRDESIRRERIHRVYDSTAQWRPMFARWRPRCAHTHKHTLRALRVHRGPGAALGELRCCTLLLQGCRETRLPFHKACG